MNEHVRTCLAFCVYAVILVGSCLSVGGCKNREVSIMTPTLTIPEGEHFVSFNTCWNTCDYLLVTSRGDQLRTYRINEDGKVNIPVFIIKQK